MRMIFPLTMITLFPFFSQAQFIARTNNMKAALASAAAGSKMIFLMMDAEDCVQCNNVADKALQDKTLKRYLEEKFVALRIGVNHPERATLQQAYNSGEGNIVLFLDEQGTLVHRFNQSTTISSAYVREGGIAYSQKKKGATFRSLEQAAMAGRVSTEDLYSLLKISNELGKPTDSLLDRYVAELPADSLKTMLVMQRIAQMSPTLGSKADIALRSNFDLFQQAWYRLPLNERIHINRQIISKTRYKAIREKDPVLALRVANFSQEINSNKQDGFKARTYNLMEYYWSVKDTLAFLQTASRYYEDYYMTQSADSIKRNDSLKLSAMLKSRLSGRRDTTRVTIGFTPSTQFFCRELNNGAWRVYTLTDQPEYLEKALLWAAHANTFYESPDAMDTLARLLYKQQKDREQAICLEGKAISLSKKRGMPSQAFEDILQKMKKGTDAIDEY